VEEIMAIERDQVEKALEKTRSVLRGDGGDVELVDVTDDGVVQVRLKGACGGCPMATMTLKSLIERVLKKELPDIKAVQQVQ
jgi:Fe-S cluster biogenesis protein NfuA